MSIKISGIGWYTLASSEEEAREYTAEPDGMGKLKYSPLESVFASTMEREGMTVSINATGEEFRAFMRRQNDNANKTDTVLFFYSVDAPVEQGKIICMGRKKYLLLNKETEENSCYYKSVGIAINGMLTTSTQAIRDMPIYAADMERQLADKGSVVSIVNGNLELLTEENAQSHSVNINDEFELFGRYFRITNIYYKDNMAHIISEIIQKPADAHGSATMNVLGITDGAAYSMNGAIQLGVELYLDDKQMNGTVQYSSSNTDVATVDDSGHIRLLREGETVIYIHWKEENIGQRYTISVTGATSSANMALSSSTNTIKVGGSYKTITAVIIVDGENITDTITAENGYFPGDFEWTASIDGVDVTDDTNLITWRVQDDLNIMKIKFGTDRSYLTKKLIIKCFCIPLFAEATLELTITAI